MLRASFTEEGHLSNLGLKKGIKTAQGHWRKEEWWGERHGGGDPAPERRLTCLECKVWEGE